MYISKQLRIEEDEYNNEIPVYGEPEYYGLVNYQHLVGNQLEAYMKAYGVTTRSVVRLFVDYIDTDKFKEQDIAYLYGATPKDELINGDNANYIIKAIKPQNVKTMILLEEIVKERN